MISGRSSVKIVKCRSHQPEVFFVKGVKKEPLEVFYKKPCSWKFRKIHRKTLVPVSFNRVARLRPTNVLKRDSGTGFFL